MEVERAKQFVAAELRELASTIQAHEEAKVDPFVTAKMIAPIFESVINVARIMEKA